MIKQCMLNLEVPDGKEHEEWLGEWDGLRAIASTLIVDVFLFLKWRQINGSPAHCLFCMGLYLISNSLTVVFVIFTDFLLYLRGSNI